MSVYSESFLQNNIVNYKLILIKNHKKKVNSIHSIIWFSFGRNDSKRMNKWHFPDSGNRVEESSQSSQQSNSSVKSQASALSNQIQFILKTVEKPRLLQRPMLARSKGGLTPKLGGSSPCSDSSSINKIAKKDQSMSKLLTIIDQQSTPQSEEIKLQVDNIQQPRINFSSLNTPTDTPTEQIQQYNVLCFVRI